jgi:uncharacterized membrane protein
VIIIGIAAFITIIMKLKTELFVVFIVDLAFLGLVILKKFLDGPAVPQSLNLLLHGMVFLVGFIEFFLHSYRH